MKFLLYSALLIGTALHQNVGVTGIEDVIDTITTEEIKSGRVVGELGVELGTCVELQATVVAGNSRLKAEDGRYFLSVTHVKGKALSTPVRLSFRTHSFSMGDIKLANHSQALYSMLKGKQPESLDAAMIKELEVGYLGNEVSLIAYESGGFAGMPRDLPADYPRWQDVGYGFQTQLLIMAQKH